MEQHNPKWSHKTYDRKIKNKRLYNSAQNILNKLHELNRYNLQLDAQDIDTKKDLWSSIDHLKSFIDNID